MEDPKFVVSFRDQNNETVFFKIGRETQILKVLKNYCKEKHLEYGTVNFYLNGDRIPRRGTVAQAGLKENDEIDVVGYAGGGGPSN